MVPFQIRTRRLVQRPLRDSDLDDVFAYRSHPRVFRHLGPTMSRSEVLEHIRAQQAGWSGRDGDALRLGVELTEEGKVIGESVLRLLSASAHQAELGCALHPQYQRLELALELCAGLLRHCFEELGMHRVCAICDVDNQAALRLMRRLGMQYEGTLREHAFRNREWRDEHVLSLLDREWPALRVQVAQFF
jgi:RimJ/RimL family protein N-acetyltransferase